MKKYLKPDVEIMDVEIDSLLQASITDIQGLDGDVTPGGEFPSGGTTDSRLFILFDED